MCVCVLECVCVQCPRYSEYRVLRSGLSFHFPTSLSLRIPISLPLSLRISISFPLSTNILSLTPPPRVFQCSVFYILGCQSGYNLPLSDMVGSKYIYQTQLLNTNHFKITQQHCVHNNNYNKQSFHSSSKLLINLPAPHKAAGL